MEKINENGITNSEFTFKQLFSLIKKSGVRILIFCLIAAFVVGITGGGIYLGTRGKNATVSALIDFNFKGIEEGKDPFGRTFDPAKIKSPAVVDKAVAAINERGGNINTAKLNNIINSITVEGIVPDEIMQRILVIKEIATKTPSVLTELNNITYHPTRYKISIKELKKAGLTKEQARLLLNEIIVQYTIEFKATYASQKLLPSEVVTIIADRGAETNANYSYDFIELYDIYNAQISSAISYLNAKSAAAPSFRSNETGKTFEDLLYSLKIIRDTDLIKYEAFIVEKGISFDYEFIMSYLKRRETTLNFQLERAEDDRADMKTALNDYKVGDIVYGVSADGTLIKAEDAGGPTEQYDRIFTQFIEAGKEVNRLQAELKNLGDRMTAYQEAAEVGETSAEEIALAKEKSQIIARQMEAIINDANLTAAEYFDTEYFNNAVHAAVTATYENNQGETLMSVALALFAAVIIAAGAAVVTTHYSLKKKGITL